MATRPPAAKKAPAAPARKATAKKGAAKPSSAAPSKQVAKPAVVTLKTVFEQLGVTYSIPMRQVQALQAEMVAALTTHLRQGVRIRMNGLGTLEVRNQPARMGRNPATGKAIEIKASKKIAFRPAKELKEAV